MALIQVKHLSRRFKIYKKAYFIFKITLTLSHNPSILIMSFFIATLAFMLCYLFKMIISLLAFWVTDIWGIFELVEVTLVIFAGNIMPIDLFPIWLQRIATTLPFSYMVYFPVIAFQGRLTVYQLTNVIAIQLVWIVVLAFLYKILWINGIKKFSGVSQ